MSDLSKLSNAELAERLTDGTLLSWHSEWETALLREAASRLQAPAVAEDGWQPIETAPNGIHLLYFPAIGGRNANSEMVRADRHPVSYPRKPSHWMPLPAEPGGSE